ncbi:MAG TPA: YeiH family protein [Candidatus Pseudomonas excrementavium]|uniref:YeiH family protein n=1 Tax=Halopseudomonas bauzanensis TaxID=653930 RepID=UPI001C3BA489|nr:YeiH family protein [Candidatus Pseudomonas excrementavium]
MWQGLGICVLLTGAGFFLAHLPGIDTSGISPLVFSLMLGLIAGNLPWAAPIQKIAPGLKFATRWLLRTGIVIFGLSVTLQQVFALGYQVVVLDMVVMITVLLVGYQLGTRWLKLDPETALLTSAGSAICGAAAILATETTIRAKPAATSMAVATVVLFGSLAMFVYPLLYSLVGWNQQLYGIFIGATVHEVAQVVAAGDAIGATALTNAVIVKLVRVMLLIPFLLIVGQWWVKRHAATGDDIAEPCRLTVPWFAFGFLAMVFFNSWFALPPTLHAAIVLGGQVALTMAMAALGYETRIEKLRSLGIRPLILALVLFVLLVTGGLGLTWLLISI